MRVPSMKTKRGRIYSATLLLLLITACSINVPVERVFGTYTASYPFGTDKITLRRDFTFVQTVTLNNRDSAKTTGRWEFDSDNSRSRVNLYGALNITDPFDNLQEDWKEPASGIVSLPVEEIWFRVQMTSSNEHPYIHD